MNILPSLERIDGVSSAGICAYADLLPYMDEKRVKWAEKLCKSPESVLVMLFPYLAGFEAGNLSKYARGRDYHEVVGNALKCLVVQLCAQYPANSFAALTDDSPLPEVMAAYHSGAGALGDNGLIFDKTHGSYVFIGTVLTDLEITPTEGKRECLHCGACAKACPAGAIHAAGVDEGKCLSALTQKGGDLDPEQVCALREAAWIWGCDICSDCCPLNASAKRSGNPAFTEGLIYSLHESDVGGLTRRAFQEKYKGRAFTWRGPAPIKRNLQLKEGKDAHKTG